MRTRMRPRGVLLALLAISVALSACGAAPVAAGRIETRHAVDRATEATLAGRLRAAEQNWQAAANAAAASGRADALARVALARCAVEQAALVWDGCPAARAYLADAGPQERAYAAYLGALSEASLPAGGDAFVQALPPPHRPIAQMLRVDGLPAELTRELASIDEPLARLVAGGVAWRAGRLDAAGVALMVDTASEQGWRRPLAAWLGVQARL
ncbi:MAG: hypothetical protein ACUVVU_06955, partial [Tepidimonas sp.]|uniref:hypothetical protein n=1 Tax=Tepidimonas sp. TaxID=2002775 RepID=UPI0040552669